MKRLVFFALCAAQAYAQSITSASLLGRVEDSSGAAVSSTAVEMSNLDRGQHWKSVSDDQGRYRFNYLPAGRYEIRISDPRFAAVPKRLTLQVGQTIDLPIAVTIAGVNTRIDVKSEVPVVESVRSEIAETILPKEIDALPLNGRNYLDLALLAPGVSRTNTGNNQRFAETSAVPGTGISITGQRNLNNSFVVDGLSANDDAAGLAGTFFSQEVIREFQVVTSGGIAEYGRASAGVINVTTQSGTNDWHARLYGFLRNQRLDARNPLATAKDPLTQGQYGATVGGPIAKDRTFLFSNFEQTRQHAAGIITIAPANANAINGVLDSIGYRSPRLTTGVTTGVTTGEFPTTLDSTNYFVRLDHRLSDRNQLAARYSLYDVGSGNARSVGGLNAISRGSSLQNRDQTVAVNDVATLSERTINEARLQFTRSRLAAPVNDLIGPAINVSGIASIGTATGSPTGRSTDLTELSENISTVRGSHAFKAGVNWLYNREDILFPGALQGVYSFSSIANLQAGRYINFQQAFGAPGQFQTNPNFGLFVQDEWRPHPKLTINAGLRYDLQMLADPVKTDKRNFSPRIGVSYTPGDRKTVIRVSYGLYYDRLPLRALSNALQRDGVNYKAALLSFGQAGAPLFPNVMPSFPDGVLTNITTINPNIASAYSRQTSFQVERELPGQMAISVSYLNLRGHHILMTRNVNVPTLSAAQAAQLGIANLGRPDPRYGNNGQFDGIGDSNYNGLTVSLNKHAGRWGGVRLSYTFSKAIDDAGNFFFSQPQNASNVRDDRGLSDNDQRHRFTLSGVLDGQRRLKGFQLSTIFSYASALPFNIQTGTDRNNDTNVNDRPEGVGRNTGRGFDSLSLDVRLSRRFHLTEKLAMEGLVEGFNVTNRTNFQLPNNVLGATFGRPNATGDPRQVQVGLRLSF